MDPNKLENYLKKKFSGKSQVASGKVFTQNSQPDTSNKNLHLTRHSSLATRPRAVLPVHLYGQPADMDSILEIANRYGLIVIEDACQAHGALYYSEKSKKWRKAGSMGLAAAFSFYPGKNLGACGEGGAVTTNDEKIAQKIRMLRDHGQAKKYYHEFEGFNGRLDAIQTAILRVKLKHLSEWNEKRRRNASLYTRHLTLATRHSNTPAPQYSSTASLATQHSSLATRHSSPHTRPSNTAAPQYSSTASLATQHSSLATRHSNTAEPQHRSTAAHGTQHLTFNTVILPYEPSWSRAVYHLYIIRTQRRDDLQRYLSENGISTGLHYPIPLHLQTAYSNKGFKEGDFPVTEKVAKEILSLPMFPQLTEQQILYVTQKIKEFYQL